jgi:hypothetical protein
LKKSARKWRTGSGLSWLRVACKSARSLSQPHGATHVLQKLKKKDTHPPAGKDNILKSLYMRIEKTFIDQTKHRSTIFMAQCSNKPSSLSSFNSKTTVVRAIGW